MIRRAATTISMMAILSCLADAQAICGDCNMDGRVDILDALHISQIAVGLIIPTPAHYLVCDVDADSDIDILDALRVAQIAAGLSVVLTCPVQPPGCTINSPSGTVETVVQTLDKHRVSSCSRTSRRLRRCACRSLSALA